MKHGSGIINRHYRQTYGLHRLALHACSLALTYAKRLLVQSMTADLPTMLRAELVNIRACFATEDVQEGMHAFLEKRKPNFK